MAIDLGAIRKRNEERRGTDPRVLCDACGEDGDRILSDIDALLEEVERWRAQYEPPPCGPDCEHEREAKRLGLPIYHFGV